MSKNQNTFIKKQKAELKKRKKREKQEKMAARKDQPKSGDLDDMIAYVDEFGNISDTPPEPEPPKKENAPRSQNPPRPQNTTQTQKFNRNTNLKS
ncbi:cold-shock protein [Algoriphagus yeomjeoni]|uniref:Uncharacterized protein n=1 Tax=Algoriphagus yeomjeoni TaxID=291403 RepID=A0A327PFJ8_9BACT|nr:cold-shock protein [Algoriphagus yeomjeoni]RAI90227.1 hypothetical protein LV83_02239 [Algoriphagus yeomjeoni]